MEAKIVERTLSVEQLQRHMVAISEYPKHYLIALAPEGEIAADVKRFIDGNENAFYIAWPNLLELMQRKGPDSGAGTVGGYLFTEFFQYMERKYYMTPFTGFRFEDGYDRDLAVHYVKRVSELLDPDIKRIYPECTNRRQSIGGAWQAWFPGEKAQDAV
ncbi:MAG: hypothetical protein RIF32_04455, partial [Leptospirales bacterium]